MINVCDLDIIYLSYDEPRADEFYSKIRNQWPKTKRVHGVKGFDSAHKACAEKATTEWFITIDGDNTVVGDFFNHRFTPTGNVLSWASKNVINDLVYGNGGIKCWNRQFVLDMKSHENAEGDVEVDFCWDEDYIQDERIFSFTHPNGSEFQAFRAGFREGVKLTLNRGNRISPYEFVNNVLWHGNIKRLQIWCSIGADVENGVWAMYGARLGTYMNMMCSDMDYSQISDYDYLSELFDRINNSEVIVEEEAIRLGKLVSIGLNMKMELFSPDGSRFFKDVYIAPKRMEYALK